MIHRLSKLSFVIALALPMLVSPAVALEITKFRSGLACLNPDPEIFDFDQAGICVDTEVIPITGQSVCVFDGKRRPCTWHGFEFEFRNASGDVKITCSSKGSAPGTIGDSHGITAKDVISFEYVIELNGESGRYFNPQYSIFSNFMEKDVELTEETVCRAGKQKLFKFKSRIFYPAVRQPTEQIGEHK